MPHQLPAITGKELIRLLEKDGWEKTRRANHGIGLSKHFSDRKRVTVVPDKRSSLPVGTLRDILGPDQTGIGFDGLAQLIDQYGLK